MLTKITDTISKLVVRFPFGIREVNCYLIRGKKGYTVIDTGSYARESIEIWENALSKVTIEKVVLTHAHPDHIGLASWLQKQVGVPVLISEEGYKEIKRNRNVSVENKLNALMIQHGGTGIPRQMLNTELSAYDVEPNGLFKGGQYITLGDKNYETIGTPGHSPDHFCFYNKEDKIMLLGDHVLENVTPLVMTMSETDNPLLAYFKSLESIRNYQTNLALPGHGSIFTDLIKEVDKTMARINYRLKQVLEAINSGDQNAVQVSESIYGKNKNFTYLLATITKLAYLESTGAINSSADCGKVKYQISN